MLTVLAIASPFDQCRFQMIAVGVAFVLGQSSVNAVQLYKVYQATLGARFTLPITLVLDLAKSAIALYALVSNGDPTHSRSCPLHAFPRSLLVSYAVLCQVENVYMSTVFLRAVSRWARYTDGPSLVRRVRDDAVVYAVAVAVVDAAAVVLSGTRVLGDFSDSGFLLEWLVVSKLTVMQLRRAGLSGSSHESAARPRRPIPYIFGR